MVIIKYIKTIQVLRDVNIIIVTEWYDMYSYFLNARLS